MKKPHVNIVAIDLFCGIGGLTYGLRKSGIKVKAGIDNDGSCQDAYERNNKNVEFIHDDIRNITPDLINEYYQEADVRVLVGCAPCQPFSAHTNKRKNKGERDTDKNFSLLLELSRLVKVGKPDIVSVENVPGLMKTEVYSRFLKDLEKEGFEISVKTVFCPEYGVPQSRKRLVILASKLGPISLIEPPYPEKSKWPTVAQFIQGLPPVQNEASERDDPYHVSMRLTDRNLERIRQSNPGGDWRDWDEDLVAACHKKSIYYAPYGRMEWNAIAPTITTQFCCYSTGRFGHPEQNRAISLREGGLLQTFPKSYQFHGKGKALSISKIARHIGNAVPVKLAEHIGESIRVHVNEH